MQPFQCAMCHHPLSFDSVTCASCHAAVGYFVNGFAMRSLRRGVDGVDALRSEGTRYIYCGNARYGVCNWLTPADGPSLCRSCRHNRTIPDLSKQLNLERWRKIESAKRCVFRQMLRWSLPMPDRREDPFGGLVFDLCEDTNNWDGSRCAVMTGHREGVITLNIAEADDAERESRRVSMGEAYRTLVGHFRHEVGHFFWDRLVRDTDQLGAFRALFGDERLDYGEALQSYYRNSARANWQENFISRYASAHPWEDFAETWAHYLHIVDALEAAQTCGISAGVDRWESNQFDVYRAKSAEQLIKAWVPLTVAINVLSRSLGQPDLYPFVLSKAVTAKLQFVHQLIQTASAAVSEAPARELARLDLAA